MTSPITVDLQTRLAEIDSVRLQAQMLATRFFHLYGTHSDDLTRDERVERDVLGGLLSDLRKLVNRFDEVTR